MIHLVKLNIHLQDGLKMYMYIIILLALILGLIIFNTYLIIIIRIQQIQITKFIFENKIGESQNGRRSSKNQN